MQTELCNESRDMIVRHLKAMPKVLILSLSCLVIMLNSCKKSDSIQSGMPIPNGDFETWDNNPSPAVWQTNSCPLCVPPFETYIVQRITDRESGSFAAKFIFNGVYKSYAQQKFKVESNPTVLTFYSKSQITNGDTAIVFCRLTQKSNVIDSAIIYFTSTVNTYTYSRLPLKLNSIQADSVFVRIEGGHKNGTEFTVDNVRISN